MRGYRIGERSRTLPRTHVSVMKIAEIVPVHASHAVGGRSFAWIWRAPETKRQSASTFVYFFDCVQDAERHGYSPQVNGKAAIALTAHRDGADARTFNLK